MPIDFEVASVVAQDLLLEVVIVAKVCRTRYGVAMIASVSVTTPLPRHHDCE